MAVVPEFYAKYYCEENIYHFLSAIREQGNDTFNKAFAVLLSTYKTAVAEEVANEWTSHVPYRPFRVNSTDDLMLWDYHVIAVVRSTQSREWFVVDFDSNLCRLLPVAEDLGVWTRWCVPLAVYAAKTFFIDAHTQFAHFDKLGDLENQIGFRVMESDEYLCFLRSDRSHMLDTEGSLRAAPSLRPPITAAVLGVPRILTERYAVVEETLGTDRKRNNLVCFINMNNTLNMISLCISSITAPTPPELVSQEVQFHVDLMPNERGKDAVSLRWRVRFKESDSATRYLHPSRLEDLMLNADGVSGFFADLPYFSPVESSTFFDLVGSHGLHKLSERMMVGSRTLEYFMRSDGNAIRRAFLSGAPTESGAKVSKAATFKFPALRQRLDSGSHFSKPNGVCSVLIQETPSRKAGMSPSAEVRDVEQPVQFDLNGLDLIWLSLIQSGAGAGAEKSFVLHNVDLCLAEKSGAGELCLVLLLVGMKSIVDFFDTEAMFAQAERKPVHVTLTVLADELGKGTADIVQVFAESVLQMPVERTYCECIESYASADRITKVNSSNQSEWLENLRACATDAHEELCDEMDNHEVSASFLAAPIILVVVPSQECTRRPLQKALLDSYSSEPIRVAQENDWTPESFSGKSPVMFLCSTSWINHECSVGGFDQLLGKLDIRCVIHGGFCEYGTSLADELTSTVSLLEKQMCEGCRVFVHQRKDQPYSQKTEYNLDQSSALQSANLILLLFRRFLLRFSPETHQPYFSLTRSLFLSHRSWDLYLRTINDLSLSGVVKRTEATSDSPVVELTVLGRFLSYRFRISDHRCRGEVPREELSAQDVKVILWAHLFRQARDIAEEIICANYSFTDWVKGALGEFCEVHSITFQTVTEANRTVLIRQLSRFGFSNSAEEVKSRPHFLLSLPYGKRIPLRSHAVETPVTTSRGWYDQAPLRMGLSVEKRQVATFCLPSSGLYCEIEGPPSAKDFRIQCPTEVSYPLIIAHSALHISLHNNCVFLESATENNAVPLPLTLLQSHTMNAILESSGLGEMGFWLDGVLSDKTLAPSDPSMLRSLLQHKPSVISFCERNPFLRKRKRQEDPTKKAPPKEEFSGVKPRSFTEEDTIDGFTKLIATVGRDKAEASLRGKKGFGFLEASHELHPYYLYVLKTKEK